MLNDPHSLHCSPLLPSLSLKDFLLSELLAARLLSLRTEESPTELGRPVVRSTTAHRLLNDDTHAHTHTHTEAALQYSRQPSCHTEGVWTYKASCTHHHQATVRQNHRQGLLAITRYNHKLQYTLYCYKHTYTLYIDA